MNLNIMLLCKEKSYLFTSLSLIGINHFQCTFATRKISSWIKKCSVSSDVKVKLNVGGIPGAFSLIMFGIFSVILHNGLQ